MSYLQKITAVLLLLGASCLAQTVTTTPYLKLRIIPPGTPLWADMINANTTDIDRYLTGGKALPRWMEFTKVPKPDLPSLLHSRLYLDDITGMLTCVNSLGNSCLSTGGISSVGITTPSWLTVSAPLLTSGTLSITATDGLAPGQFLATPVGVPGPVALRAIAVTDIPAGFNAQVLGGVSVSGIPTVGQVLGATSATTAVWISLGTGSVTSFSAGNLAPIFTSGVATATVTPALTFTLSTAAPHTFLGNNTGSTATPGYQTIGSLDLPTTTVNSIVNDTNITGSIATRVLTLGWSGTLAKTRTLATTAYTDQTNTFGAFVQTFQGGANYLIVDPTDVTKKFQFDISNVGTGTTRTVNIPNVNSTTAQPITAVTSKWITAMSAQGLFTLAQPAYSDLTGTPVLPVNTTSTANQFFTAYDSSTGAFTKAQPAFTNISGTLLAGQEPATTVNSVSNDTNVTGVIATQGLTLGWTGTLAKARTLATTVYTDQANTYTTGIQRFLDGTNTEVVNVADVTKIMKWDISAVGTGTTITIKPPNSAQSSPVADLDCTGTGHVLKITAGVLTCSADASGFANPMTTLGDTMYENVTPVATRLAGNITATKMYLSQTGNGSISAAPAWAQVAYGDLSGVPSTFAPSAHNLLSTAHGDSTASAAVRGGGIFAIGASPLWTQVAHSAATGGYFKWNGTDVVASTNAAAGPGTCTNQFVSATVADDVPTCTTVTLASAQFANQGTTTTVLHGNAAGNPSFAAITSADTTGTFAATAHNLLNSTTHGDTTTGTVARGDLITGQGSSPKWVRLAKGTLSQCLQMDGSGVDIIWASCPGGGFSNPMTTLGDIMYENATPAAARLAGNITLTKMFLSSTGTGSVSATPAWAALTGADLPNPGVSTLGGIRSYTPVLHQWISSISTMGVPNSTQPVFADLSDAPVNATSTVLVDEFIGGVGTAGSHGNLGWNSAQIVGTTSAISGIAGGWPHNGVARLTTQAIQGDGISLYLGASSVQPLDDLNTNTGWDETFIFRINSTTNMRFRIGFASGATTTEPAAGIWLRYDTNAAYADTAFSVVARTGSANTTGATTYAVDTGWHKIRIRSEVSGQVIFTFDSNVDQTISSGVPTTALLNAVLCVSDTTVAQTCDVDWFLFTIKGLAR